jgi:hypothetical protein
VVQVGLQNVTLQQKVCEFALSNDVDKPRCLQLFHVMGKSGCGYGLAFAYVGAGNTPSHCANLFQDLMAARIGQSLRDQPYLPL